MDILTVCKDPGGTMGVLAVVQKLRTMRQNVALVANGKAIDILRASGEQFTSCSSIEIAVETFGLPRVLITSMCTGGGVGRDLVPLLHRRGYSIALQDFWGSLLWTEWANLKFRPDYICVNDEVGASIICNAWPNFLKDHIKIFGYPALDRYAGYDTIAASHRVRNTLALDQQKPIILFGGEPKVGSVEMLHELIIVLDDLRADAYFIPRVHPRMKDNVPEEFSKWNVLLENSKLRNAILIRDSSACDMQSMIAAADIVLSMFSNILVEAAVLRKPNISILYPDVGMQLWQKEMKGNIEDFPLVSLCCSAKATNRDGLKTLLGSALAGKLSLQDAQEHQLRADGNNAQRITNFVISLL